MILTIVGALAMIGGAFLVWAQGVRGTEIHWEAFFSTEAQGGADVGIATSAGMVLVVLGLLAVLGLAFRTGWLTRLAAALGLVALILLTVSLFRADTDLGLGFWDLGYWICVAGSLLALIGGFLGSRPRVVATSVPAY
jgi:hypothetical protein